MKIKILDYKDRVKECEVGELENIKKMIVNVGTGDEVLMVEYNDGTDKTFDSSDDRTRWFFDGWYELYNKEKGINELENSDWKNRTHYSYLNEFGDTSDADMSDWW